ncbi:MAG TPA: hypothetical protein ENK15_05810 [Thermopetrobacter sp.]|nr:hypothetical protein [Thermopetrobacter sp.]
MDATLRKPTRPRGSLLALPGFLSARYPRLALILIVLLTLTAAAGLSSLYFDDDVESLFDVGDSISRATERLHTTFPGLGNDLLVLVEAKAPFSASQLTAIREMHLQLRFVAGVKGVVSPASAREPPDDKGYPAPLIPAELKAGRNVTPLLRTLRDHPLVGFLLAPDATAALIIIDHDPKIRGLRASARLLRDIRATIGPVASAAGLTVTMTGTRVLRHEVVRALNRDLLVLTAIGAFIALLLCIAFFRNLPMVVMAFVPPVLAVIWMLGAFGLSGTPVTALSNVLPTLIMVIAICDAMHLTWAIRRALTDGRALPDAVRHALEVAGPACAMTSLTTALACLTLLASESPAVSEFGLQAAAAVMAAFVAVLMGVPLLALMLLRGWRPAPARPGGDLAEALRRAALAMTAFGIRHARLVAAVALALLAVSMIGYQRIEASYVYRDYLSADSPANRAVGVISDKFGGIDHFYVLVETDRAHHDAPPPALVAAHRAMAARPQLRGVYSWVSVRDWLRGGRADARTIAAKIPPRLGRLMTSADGRSFALIAYMPNMDSRDAGRLLRQLGRMLKTIERRHPGSRISIAGLMPKAMLGSPKVIDRLKVSLLFAVIAALVVIGLFVRSWRLMLAAAVPALLPITLLTLGIWATGGALTLSVVLAMTIAFGIAVDDAIHLLFRLRLEMDSGRAARPALLASAEKMGAVLFASTLVLGAGMAVSWLSDMPTAAQFGTSALIVLILALLATIMVVPAYTVLLCERNVEKDTPP